MLQQPEVVATQEHVRLWRTVFDVKRESERLGVGEENQRGHSLPETYSEDEASDDRRAQPAVATGTEVHVPEPGSLVR